MADYDYETDTTIPRFGTENFVGKWQAKGDHYISFENLKYLYEEMNRYKSNKNKIDKKNLLNELSTTYFARFHNLIRNEFQHEKSLVEDRIKSWSNSRLQQEGFTLFDVLIIPKGNLFQDKIFRVKMKNDAPLPFHRFSVGDSIRVSLSYTGDPLSDDSSTDGVVLERKYRHIDICVKNQEDDAKFKLNVYSRYRIDHFVNRIAFDRMIEALLLFVQTTEGAPPLSRTIRDILLFSYPSSLIDMANSPGGLKLALPNLPPRNNFSTSPSLGHNNSSSYSSKAALGQSLQNKYRPPGYQHKREFNSFFTGEKKEDRPSFHFSDIININRINSSSSTSSSAFASLNPSVPTKPFTIADALGKVKREDKNIYPLPNDKLLRVSDTNENDLLESRRRLTEMALKMPLVSGTFPYTVDEIRKGLNDILDRNSVKSGFQLNPSQMKSLNNAILRPLTLIQGPPGTGKTRTACSILATLAQIKSNREREGGEKAKGLKHHKILACAQSNTAADNLLEGLILLGVNVVRFGRPANVRESLWDFTVDSRLQKRPSWVRARGNLDNAVKNYNSCLEKGGEALGIAQRELASAKEEFKKVEISCFNNILRGADVVVSSTIGAGAESLKKFSSQEKVSFSTVLVDEATQCTEAASLTALVLGCERLILVGDQNQLPPVVLSPIAAEKGLGASLFSRLITAGIEPYLLNEQYRMHPKIAEFSSNYFYGGLVTSVTSSVDRPVPYGFDWVTQNHPITFVDVSHQNALLQLRDREFNSYDNTNDDDSTLTSFPISGGFERLSQSSNRINDKKFSLISRVKYNRDQSLESESENSPKIQSDSDSVHSNRKKSSEKSSSLSSSQMAASSYYNLAEVDIIESIIEDLINIGDVKLNSIGVISPYNAQVKQLIDKFRSRGWVDKDDSFASEDDDGDSSTTNSSFTSSSSKPSNNYISPNSRPRPSIQLNSINILNSTPSSIESNDTDFEFNTYGSSINVENLSRDKNVSKSHNTIEVQSVDGFQGREKDIIIFSAVRSNRQGKVGFLQDWRRLNVAITRAKSGLIIVGDSSTLSNDPHWNAYVKWCKDNNCYKFAKNGDIYRRLFGDSIL